MGAVAAGEIGGTRAAAAAAASRLGETDYGRGEGEYGWGGEEGRAVRWEELGAVGEDGAVDFDDGGGGGGRRGGRRGRGHGREKDVGEGWGGRVRRSHNG